MKINIGGGEGITINLFPVDDTGGMSGELITTIERDEDVVHDSMDGAAYNAAVNGLEGVLLALACAGLITEGPKLDAAVEVALSAIVESYT